MGETTAPRLALATGVQWFQGSVAATGELAEISMSGALIRSPDSPGVGEILRLFKRMREVNGEVVLINANKKLHDLFLMYRFDRFMKICDATDLDAV